MSDWLIGIGFVVFMLAFATVEHLRSPYCQWCDWRHFGRCHYNPRARGLWANVNDGHFDYNDPNK